jgi:hypothetical protein
MRKWDRDPALLSDYGYLQARAEPPSMLGSGLASGLIDVIKCFQAFSGGIFSAVMTLAQQSPGSHEAYGVPAQRRNNGHQQEDEDIDRNDDRVKAVPLDPGQK